MALVERAVITATTIDLLVNEAGQEKGIDAAISVPWSKPALLRRQIIPIEGDGVQPAQQRDGGWLRARSQLELLLMWAKLQI
jgi:hypothetical protein